ncbi:MAG TPA: hypothetical protein VK821_09765, partial [Dehalococcoidia bacterium]|nr:hypothetical protein [Dehalococcoidia bacterium]
MTPPAARPAAEAGYGLCPTRGTDDPRRRPWHYGHAAGIEGLHWDIYAGEGADGWLVASVGTEADAALIVSNVNAAAESDASALRTALMEECRDCRTPEQSATLTGYVCP